MPNPSRRCKVIALLLLCTLLTASGAFAAAPPAERAAAPAALEILNRAWGYLSSLWGKTGCNIDPDGRCAPEPQKTGCGIDPSGGCAGGAAPLPGSPQQTETGCHIDPNGRCNP